MVSHVVFSALQTLSLHSAHIYSYSAELSCASSTHNSSQGELDMHWLPSIPALFSPYTEEKLGDTEKEQTPPPRRGV